MNQEQQTELLVRMDQKLDDLTSEMQYIRTKLQGNGQKGYFERTAILEEKMEVIETKISLVSKVCNGCGMHRVTKSKVFIGVACFAVASLCILTVIHIQQVWPVIEKVFSLL